MHADPVYHPADVRRDRVVAGAVLIAALALVAVPGPAGSRSPGADPVLTAQEFTPVVMERALDGAAPTDDPALRSASFLEEDGILREPVAMSADPARPAAPQPAAAAGAESKNPWRLDRNISWYGPGFYGRRTACGYTMTTSLVGVAHRTLPCGTKVIFRNPANGRTVVARVVDRGPYVSGRQWDMTAGLCKALGHCYTGSIQWRRG
jgi:rare lipoprotein A (peptidoglycan hydrolase)